MSARVVDLAQERYRRLHNEQVAREEALFGEVISRYTREQAIADGVLVDVSEMAREAGFVWPVAVTAETWQECVVVPKGAEGWQDEAGRLWDVLWLARCAAKRGAESFGVSVITTKGGQRRNRFLRAVAGPGDDGAPVVTIMGRFES